MTKLDTGNIDMMIEKVCRIPVEFKSAGTRSVNDLVKESGYLENTAFLTVESVESCLRKHPGLANAWLQYSEDKRTDAGWYLRRIGEGTEYEMGRLQTGERAEFADQVRAAAEFVIREVRSIQYHMT